MAILQISLEELRQWERENRAFSLIDVREREEHDTYNIGGILIPLSELAGHIEKFGTTKPFVFYCQKGIRSQIAIQRLKMKYPHGEFYNLNRGVKHLNKMS